MKYRRKYYGVCQPGFKAGGSRKGKYGVALILADRVCETAAVFTRNTVKAAPVKYTRRMFRRGVQAVVANSGNANCCVPEGMNDAGEMVEEAADVLKVDVGDVAVSSTGIIGRRMDVKTVRQLIRETSVRSGRRGSSDAAKAIMTTDTRMKMYAAEYRGIRVGGICKGAGMIAPDMATMLCYITTNADLPRSRLQEALSEAVGDSFNMISVEGDMSTNDTVLLMSNRTRKCGVKDFKGLMKHVTAELAKMIVRDGEGASKFIEVEVKGAKSVKDARTAVNAVINSPLVKTAFYGENPNWGRITAAIGSRIKVDESRVDITYSSGRKRVKLVSKGGGRRTPEAKKVMKNRDIKVTVDLRMGRYQAVGWGCDLTEEYVRVNAGYS